MDEPPTSADQPTIDKSENGSREVPRKPRVRILRLLLIGLATYLIMCMLIAFLQTKLIYFPTAAIEATPADFGMEFEDVRLRTSDGVSISAWYVTAPNSRADILFFHGNAGNNGHRVAELQVLRRLGFNVLIVDYRGFGQSEGYPSEQGTYLDAEAAWEYLVTTRNVSPDRIVIMGESLGGAVAIELASRHKPAALVVQSSFTRLADIGSLHYPFLPVHWILQHRYDSIDKIGRLNCPKLFIHSTDDALVPLSNGKALFDAAAEPKQFIQTPGEHNTGGFMYTDETAAKLRDFILKSVH